MYTVTVHSVHHILIVLYFYVRETMKHLETLAYISIALVEVLVLFYIQYIICSPSF